MSSEKAICVRFPNGEVEFTFTSATPHVGDKVKRGDDAWEVSGIWPDENDNTVVTLGPPAEREAELVERPDTSPSRNAEAAKGGHLFPEAAGVPALPLRDNAATTPADEEASVAPDEELDWKSFVGTFFPGAHRHNFEAIIAYSDYRRSFRVSRRSASENLPAAPLESQPAEVAQ